MPCNGRSLKDTLVLSGSMVLSQVVQTKRDLFEEVYTKSLNL